MLDDEAIETVLNDVLDKYGYDFTRYSKASIKRRINRLYAMDNFPSFAEFRYRLLHDKEYIAHFVEEVTVNVTEMFRDPQFYKALRNEILPVLATYPYIRIWHAGCSTGEEVYSMAILLKELNLLHKSLLYATDISPQVLEIARAGIYKLGGIRLSSENYVAAGGQQDFSAYYTAQYDHALLERSLSERMIFSTHNLVSDSSFNEFQLILCRNVLIYFEKDLQDKVLTLFDNSLENLGFLALGAKETMRFTQVAKYYKLYSPEKIWRKG